MSSFTSNFRKELPVLAVVGLALAAGELGLRAQIRRLSIDVRHIEEEIPRLAERKPKVLFLGNSLTRAGVVPEELGLKDAGLVYPDDTTIADWHYLYERHFLAKGAVPDVLFVGFAGDHLADGQALHLDRLGAHFAGLEGAPEAFEHDVRDFDSRVTYLLSSVSSAFANRERVRTQAFAALIPGYRRTAQALNKAAKPRPPVKKEYGRLKRFLERAKGSRVFFVRIPVPGGETVDPALRELLGPRLIDVGEVPGLDWPDGYHLSPRGGAAFTRALKRKLPP